MEFDPQDPLSSQVKERIAIRGMGRPIVFLGHTADRAFFVSGNSSLIEVPVSSEKFPSDKGQEEGI